MLLKGYQSLLCPGTPSPPLEPPTPNAATDAAGAGPAAHAPPQPAQPLKTAASIQALESLLAMADAQNDHLRIAAKVVAGVVVEARRHEAEAAARGRIDEGGGEESAARLRAAALLSAWAPWRQGVKEPWWETARTADAATGLTQDEFKVVVRKAAETSLALLVAALPGAAEDFPALFTLDVWASILGMLDLNCMGIRVGSPVKMYLDAVLQLPPTDPGREEAWGVASQLCQLLPGVMDSFCDGTGFFSLQSVINHDCNPNVMSGKHADDEDNKIAIRALRDIQSGEELSLSYIERSMPVAERQAALQATYKFKCTCTRCVQEVAANESAAGDAPPSGDAKRQRRDGTSKAFLVST